MDYMKQFKSWTIHWENEEFYRIIYKSEYFPEIISFNSPQGQHHLRLYKAWVFNKFKVELDLSEFELTKKQLQRYNIKIRTKALKNHK